MLRTAAVCAREVKQTIKSRAVETVILKFGEYIPDPIHNHTILTRIWSNLLLYFLQIQFIGISTSVTKAP
ncbi:hypothetical protein D3C71_1424350 [compost metagenome]